MLRIRNRASKLRCNFDNLKARPGQINYQPLFTTVGAVSLEQAELGQRASVVRDQDYTECGRRAKYCWQDSGPTPGVLDCSSHV